jgi:DeoR family fructose operon transcriptional repressor
VTITGSVATEDRRNRLRHVLRDEGAIELKEAAEKLGVHPMTVRRDLDFLEQEGLARRVRGGAVFVGLADFRQRHGRELAAKRRIATKLLPLLPKKQSVGLDASTTIFQFASAISQAEQLSVVTNGLSTFEILQHRAGIRAFLTGGESEEQNASLVGPVAIAAVSNFLFSRSFMSTTSLDPGLGTSEPTASEVGVKRALADASQHVVLAVDSSKLDTRSVVRALTLDRIHLLVTELDPLDIRLDPYRNYLEIL